VVALIGTVIKIPFVLVPSTMALLAFLRRDWRRGLFLGGGAAVGLLLAFLVAQYLFADVGHFSAFHLGGRHLQDQPAFLISIPQLARGMTGLLLDPASGLLCFSPFLVWGLASFRRGGKVYLPAIAFYLFHSSYLGWAAGACYSARFLVPVLPILVLAVSESKKRGKLFKTCVVYSLVFGMIAGTLPVAVFERTPWQIVDFVIRELSAALA
jgi:hypothetical protein